MFASFWLNFNQELANYPPGQNVGKHTPPTPKNLGGLSIESIVGAQRTDIRRKTDPRLVYLDEGRHPSLEPLPLSRGRGTETRQDPQTTSSQRAGGILWRTLLKLL